MLIVKTLEKIPNLIGKLLLCDKKQLYYSRRFFGAEERRYFIPLENLFCKNCEFQKFSWI